MRITWWGHASVTLELGGLRVLTDPALTARLAHLHRIGSPVPPPAAARADVVLVSHLHADHLHLPSLRRVDTRTLVVPAGGGRLARRAGCADVREVTVGETTTFGQVEVTAVRAAHDGRRLPGSRHRGPALGYVLQHGATRVWFAGDTGPCDGIAELGPVDVAVVPIGGWGPTLGDGHLDPVQAAAAVDAVGARHAVPIHYGTFWPVGLRPLAPGTFHRMFDEPGERFAAAVDGSATTVHLLAPGASTELADG